MKKLDKKPYILGFLVVAAALFGARHIPPFSERGGYLLLMLGVTITTWYGGFGPGLFAIVISAVGGVAFLDSRGGTAVQENFEEVFRVSLFVSVAFLINTLQVARERAERSVHESDRRLGFLLRAAAVGCWDADLKAGTFWSSANLPEIFGRPSETFPSTFESYLQRIHPEDIARVRNAMLGADADEFEIEHRILDGQGAIRKVSTRGRIIRDGMQKPRRLVATVASIKDPSTDLPVSAPDKMPFRLAIPNDSIDSMA